MNARLLTRELFVSYQHQARAMSRPPAIEGSSLTLLTDLYQLTMAQGYWKLGRSDRSAVFTASFRNAPFHDDHAVACGLGPALDFLERFRFHADDLAYLASIEAPGGGALFDPVFVRSLADLSLSVDVYAVPEGTIVHAHEPLLRIEGPLLQAQLLETALLTHLNFSTLVATKAARLCRAAGTAPVLEFGLRRAQGVDGGLTASRAAYIGGCAATSNVLAGRRFNIPVRGTHAHSWVMSFDDETEAFAAYAEVMPHNCVLLVDTYDSIVGIEHAIEIGKRLRERGAALSGIRLDSGDLAELSRRARTMLDAAGLTDVQIVASDGLDEHEIRRLREEGARIDVWGVGTQLATSYDEPALGGVYKLSAIADANGQWRATMKRSSDPSKASLPGRLQVRRHIDPDGAWIDTIYDVADTPPAAGEDLLVPAFTGGRRRHFESTDDARRRSVSQSQRYATAPRPAVVKISEQVRARREELLRAMPEQP